MNPADEYTKFWRVPQIEGLELLHATYVTQNFSCHMHDCYAFGVVEQGVQAYYYRGAQHTAPPGTIVNCLPGEVHTGHAAPPEGWTYRMFYLSPDILGARLYQGSRATPSCLPHAKAGDVCLPTAAHWSIPVPGGR